MQNDRSQASQKEVPAEVVPLKRTVDVGQVMLDVQAGLREVMLAGGMALVEALFKQDLETLCGPRYTRKQEGMASRWGEQRGEVVLGGRKVAVTRPRARRDGKEVPLPSYQQFQYEDPIDDRALEQMLVGVSTRKYRRSLEPVIPGLDEKSISKSEVSRRFIVMTQAQVDALLSKPLGEVEWAALMVDGIAFAEHVVVVALGIDVSGKKHLLGVREGSTENATLCKEMLSGIVARGFPVDCSILVTIDGGKGLRKAITEVFGQFAVVQRCLVHKRRNVLEQLPEKLRAQVKAALNQAYSAASYETALRQLQNQARTLEKSHPGAAESLREGLEETLTLQQLGLSGRLARSLATTNPIENLNGTLRHVSDRVKRWRNGNMVVRWVAAGASEAQKGFRRLKGYADMPKLVAILRARDERMKQADVRHAG